MLTSLPRGRTVSGGRLLAFVSVEKYEFPGSSTLWKTGGSRGQAISSFNLPKDLQGASPAWSHTRDHSFLSGQHLPGSRRPSNIWPHRSPERKRKPMVRSPGEQAIFLETPSPRAIPSAPPFPLMARIRKEERAKPIKHFSEPNLGHFLDQLARVFEDSGREGGPSVVTLSWGSGPLSR